MTSYTDTCIVTIIVDKMLVSMIFLGLQSYLLSAETLDGTSTEFLKEYIQATNMNNILIIKEKVGG